MQSAAAALLQYDLFARPSEVLRLRGRDLVAPVPTMSSYWGVLFDSDFEETTKAGETDDVVLADSLRRASCNAILQHIGRSMLHEGEPVITLTLQQFEQDFQAFSATAKLPAGTLPARSAAWWAFALCVTAASHFATKTQLRGRWKSSQSVERYKKPGRLLLPASRLPEALRKFNSQHLGNVLRAILKHSWVS